MNNIPAAPDKLFGRENELDKLVSSFPDYKVLQIAGFGGTGKTALASTFAMHLEKEGYLVVWIKYQKSWSIEEFCAAISGGMESIGAPGLKEKGITPDLESVINLFADGKAILFIDDFHDAPDWADSRAMNLIMEKGARIVIITRRKTVSRENLKSVFLLDLCGIPEEQTISLINDLEEKHDISISASEKKKIAVLTKGHPLSVKLLIGLFISGYSDCEGLLNNKNLYHEQMEEILFNNVFKDLSEKQLLILKQLSVFRINLNREKLKQRLGIFIEDLNVLSGRYLLEYSEKQGVFVQDVIREYIFSITSEKDFLEIHSRAAFYCVSDDRPYIIKEAFHHFIKANQPEKAIDAALKLTYEIEMIGDEADAVFQILQKAARLLMEYRKKDLLVNQIWFLIYRDQLNQAEKYLQEIESDEDRLRLSALLEYRRENYQKTVELIDRLLHDYPQYQQDLLLMSYLGRGCFFSGDKDRAALILENLYKKIDNINHLTTMSYILIGCAELEVYRCRYKEAIELMNQIKKTKLWESKSIRCSIKQNIALCQLKQGEYDPVWNTMLELEAEAEKMGNYSVLIECLRIRQKIAASRKDKETTLAILRRHAELAEKQGDTVESSRNSILKGISLLVLECFEEAVLSFEIALEKFKTSGSEGRKTSLTVHYALSLLLCGRVKDAEAQINSLGDNPLCTVSLKLNICMIRKYICFSRCDEQSAEKYKKEFDKIISEISPEAAKPLLEDCQAYSRKLDEIILENPVIIDGIRKKVRESDLDLIREKKASSPIFIDFPRNEVYVDGVSVSVFKKKVLSVLFKKLAMQPFVPVSPDDLFFSAWKRKQNPYRDKGKLRGTMSRLKLMLDRNNSERFIKRDEAHHFVFSPDEPFCIIF